MLTVNLICICVHIIIDENIQIYLPEISPTLFRNYLKIFNQWISLTHLHSNTTPSTERKGCFLVKIWLHLESVMDQTKRPLLIPPEFGTYAEKHGLFDLYKVWTWTIKTRSNNNKLTSHQIFTCMMWRSFIYFDF